MSESWDFYFCRVDHRPASIFLDSGIFESTPFRSRPHLAYLRLFFRIDREDGLTSDEESDTLREIEHGLQEELARHGDRLQYVGHNTTDGSRVFCIYTVNGVWAETVLSSYMTRFPDYEFEAGWQDDPDWSVYLDFLYPDARAAVRTEGRSRRIHRSVARGRLGTSQTLRSRPSEGLVGRVRQDQRPHSHALRSCRGARRRVRRRVRRLGLPHREG